MAPDISPHPISDQREKGANPRAMFYSGLLLNQINFKGFYFLKLHCVSKHKNSSNGRRNCFSEAYGSSEGIVSISTLFPEIPIFQKSADKIKVTSRSGYPQTDNVLSCHRVYLLNCKQRAKFSIWATCMLKNGRPNLCIL